MMQRMRYEFALKADLPIAHHSDTQGNHASIMRRKVRQKGGWCSVPCVTADTMRHGLREAGALALLDAVGLKDLSEGALRLLFAGGMVTGRGDAGVISLDRYRELCELVPTMELLGGCSDNRVIPGRLSVEDATLICEETAQHLPEWAVEHHERLCGELDTYRAHIEDVQRTRMDPTLSPERRLLLSADAQVKVTQQLTAGEAAHDTDDAPAREATKSSMLPRTFQRVAQGSLFHWAVEARCYSDLAVDTFRVCVGAFLAHCYVGGKRGTGHGRFVVVGAREVEVLAPSRDARQVDAMALGPRVGELFRAHVAERAEQIRSFFAAGINA